MAMNYKRQPTYQSYRSITGPVDMYNIIMVRIEASNNMSQAKDALGHQGKFYRQGGKASPKIRFIYCNSMASSYQIISINTGDLVNVIHLKNAHGTPPFTNYILLRMR